MLARVQKGRITRDNSTIRLRIHTWGRAHPCSSTSSNNPCRLSITNSLPITTNTTPTNSSLAGSPHNTASNSRPRGSLQLQTFSVKQGQVNQCFGGTYPVTQEDSTQQQQNGASGTLFFGALYESQFPVPTANKFRCLATNEEDEGNALVDDLEDTCDLSLIHI